MLRVSDGYAQAMELLHTAHVPRGDGPHPTLLLLHGWGASAHDLLGLAPILHGGQALVLCPQGSLSMEAAPGLPGYGWFPLGDGREPDPADVSAAVDALWDFLEAACECYAVDPARLVLGGFSQGGFMAFQLALRAPARFAALLAMSTWLPEDLAEAVEKTPAHAALPTLLVHGSDDPAVPVERAHDTRDALEALGMRPEYREYAMGHEIRPEALEDIMAWLDNGVWKSA